MYKFVITFFSVLFLLLIGCKGKQLKDFQNTETSGTAAVSTLSAFELENGIGPIKEKLQLAPISKPMVKAGEKLFVEKCSACHKLDEKYIGPAQRDVIKRRSPEYIVNMMMNPQEMIEKHPEAKKMLAIYLAPMANQSISRPDALKILEYFRSVVDQKK